MRNPAVSYPALMTAVGQMLIACLVAFGLHLSVIQTAAVLAFFAALGGGITGLLTHPRAVAPLAGLLTAGGTLMLAFKLPHVTSGELSAFNALVAMFAMKFVHSNVSPAIPAPVAPPEHAR